MGKHPDSAWHWHWLPSSWVVAGVITLGGSLTLGVAIREGWDSRPPPQPVVTMEDRIRIYELTLQEVGPQPSPNHYAAGDVIEAGGVRTYINLRWEETSGL